MEWPDGVITALFWPQWFTSRAIVHGRPLCQIACLMLLLLWSCDGVVLRMWCWLSRLDGILGGCEIAENIGLVVFLFLCIILCCGCWHCGIV